MHKFRSHDDIERGLNPSVYKLDDPVSTRVIRCCSDAFHDELQQEAAKPVGIKTRFPDRQ